MVSVRLGEGKLDSSYKVAHLTGTDALTLTGAQIVEMMEPYDFAAIIAAMNQTNQTGNETNQTGNQTNQTNSTNATNSTATFCYNFLLSQALANISTNTSVDFSGDLTRLTQMNNTAISKSLLYSVIAPIFSLIITVVFVRELANILGSEIGLKTIASV